MSNYITLDRKVIFENRTEECNRCEDGKSYIYVETCKTCNGAKKFLKGTRRYKCKTCKGNGYTMLDKRIEAGSCPTCQGTRRVPLTPYSQVTLEDREWFFQNLFNLDKPYTKTTSSFNEEYLGLGIICGYTDYGRYQSLTPEEFLNEVKESFMSNYLQYVSILNKNGDLPAEILIKKSSSGWFAYPVYNN